MTRPVTANRGALAPDARTQALRFVLAGTTVAAVHVALGLMLIEVASVPVQAAIPVAHLTAVMCHFALQRWFVFARTDFALSATRQLALYLPLAVAQYLYTAAATAVLPEVLGWSASASYVLAVASAAAVTFLALRLKVFA